MKQSEIEEALMSLWVLVKETSPIIIGSQALHGRHPDLADDIMYSREVDVILPNKARMGRWLNEVVGDDTPYAVDRGYYIDHVMPVEGLPIFAAGWEGRLIKKTLSTPDKEPLVASYLSPEDLVICKLGAGREKDLAFVEAIVRRGIVTIEAVQELVEAVPVPYQAKVTKGIQNVRVRLEEADPKPPAPTSGI